MHARSEDFRYIEAMLEAGTILSPPENLAQHVYARYIASPGGQQLVLGTDAEEESAGLERLDPVFLMDVDPLTARWKSEHGDRTIYFCSPGCKKSFDRHPQEYLDEIGLGDACGAVLHDNTPLARSTNE